MSIVKLDFGETREGLETQAYILTNKSGASIKLTNYGAAIVEIKVSDREGKLEDVVLGYDDALGYSTGFWYYGALIGRYANRIGNASFMLNDKMYKLTGNDRGNTLHSGWDAYCRRLWNASYSEEEGSDRVTFILESPDGDQGFPGKLTIIVNYIFNDENELKIDYLLKAEEDTVANITNHSYFNLAGHDSGDVLSQKVYIASNKVTALDKNMIATGVIVDVTGTPLDFMKPKCIGQDIGKDFGEAAYFNEYDNNYVFENKFGMVQLAAYMEDEVSGRKMEVFTDMPGMQFYTANPLNDKGKGKGGASYLKHSAACFETQFLPNAVNIETFETPKILAGEEFHTTTIYKFSTI